MENEYEIVDSGAAQSMGVSDAAYEEIVSIIGRMPTITELSTLMAMWQLNGCQQSLLGWLKGQHHTVEKNDYIYKGDSATHKEIREPKTKDCIEIAKSIIGGIVTTRQYHIIHGKLIYMIGNISSEFLGSEYAIQNLHLSENPRPTLDADEKEYYEMIIDALQANSIIESYCEIGKGGLFATLARMTKNANCKSGFDILTCKEVRLDAFLFGEEQGRYVATIDECNDDTFLAKIDEAGINCCFLGRATKGRILVDGMDFGDIEEY